MMNYADPHSRSAASSFFDAFSLNPPPYRVLLVLAVIGLFLGIKWHVSYEEAVESAEESFNWLLLLVPVGLIFVVRGLSNMEAPGWLIGGAPWDRSRKLRYLGTSEGNSPWGVAALIVLLLVLLQFKTTFLDM